MTLKNMSGAISSPGSRDGTLPSTSPDGEMPQSGPEAAPVSRFRARDSERELTTNATSGPLFTASSPSASLQRCLENRLRARMDVNGSLEYGLIWSVWDMPAGLPICRLRASAHPRFGKEYFGYPTVRASERGPRNPVTAQRKMTADGRTRHHRIEDLLTALGTRTGYPNPKFLSWMMGFQESWGISAPTGTPSSRK